MKEEVIILCQDGMLVEEQSIRSLDMEQVDLQLEEEKEKEEEKEAGEEGKDAKKQWVKEDDNPYNRFLDIMEIF